MFKRYSKIILAVAILSGIFLGCHFVFAQVDTGIEQVGTEIALGGTDIRVMLARIIRIFLGLLGIIMVGLILYGGFIWMTAGGDPKKVTQAKSFITNAVIGLIIILSSFAISQFILNSLIQATTKEGGGITIPPGGSGGGFGSNVFVVRTVSPAGSVPIRNVTVRVVFNQNIDAATVDGNILVTKGAENILGTFTTAGSVVEFAPVASCPEPNEDRKCFDADADYHVSVAAAVTSRGGLSLSCGGFAPKCEGDFHTGSLVDVSAPTVFVRNPAQNARLPQDTLINLEAQADDDSGVSYVEFYADDNLVDIGAAPEGQTPLQLIATGFWSTNGVTVGTHALKAKAFDIDANNAYSEVIFVNILPYHCFNGIEDSGETGIDCGGECGACTGSGCSRDSDCATGSCIDGQCREMPIISGIDPQNGKAGNYVTVSGDYFGATPGQVVFAGSSDPMDDKVAPLADCASAWQSNQIIVSVPEGAVNGPIKVVTADFLEDITNDSHGPIISDFTMNEIIRPGICGLNPSSGVRGDVFVISGNGFGESRGVSQALMADRDINPQVWGNGSITGIVPALAAGRYGVRVLAGLQQSNAVSFKVNAEETGLKPIISYIDPTSAAKEDYITVFGSNFGSTAGLVIFKNKRTVDEAYGATDFPEECGANFWKSNSVTVKVPKFYTDNRTAVAFGSYDIRIKRQDGIESVPVAFSITDTAPRPGLCALLPNNGPAGRTRVDLIGERFGTAQSQVKFYRERNASVFDWTNNKISVASPEGSQTGPVKVLVGALESNSLNFTVSDCNASGCGTGEQCCADGVCIPDTDQCVTGPRQGGYLWKFSTGIIPFVPQVVEECAESVSPSPAPWDARQGGNSVCVNAAIGARFTTDIDETTITDTNLSVYKCVGPTVDEKGKSLNPCLEVEHIYGRLNITSNSFTFTPVSNFATSSRYRVNLGRYIRGDGEGGGYMAVKEDCGIDWDLRPRDGLEPNISYCFEFKTRAEAQNCELGNVIVNTAEKTADQKDQVINYNASAISKDDICILLNGDAYDWNWDVFEDAGPISVRATVTENDISGGGASGTERNDKVDPAQEVTCRAETIPDHPVRVTASVLSENRSDYGELTIDFIDPRITEYWPDCDTACVNAEIGMEVNVAIDVSSLPENVHLHKCENESCRNLIGELSISALFNESFDELSHKLLKTIKINHPTLEASTYYRVIVDGGQFGIKSTSGAELAGANYGANYSWTFKTRDSSEPCEIDSVTVKPPALTLKYIGETKPLESEAVGAPDDCNPQGQRLTAEDYAWQWTSEKSDVVSLYYAADGGLLNVLPHDVLVKNCSANCLNTGTPGGVSVCGNGRVENGEDCDDGNITNDDGCSEKCLNEGSVKGGSTCGDGNRGKGEDCDKLAGDSVNPGCSNICLNKGSSLGGSICGNGDLGDGEDCDDGNTSSGDGCSADCLNEGSLTGPYPVCGNSTIEDGEDCDDGNKNNGDGCSANCLNEGTVFCARRTDLNCCGNGIPEAKEDCDDRNNESGDGCSARCLNEGSNIKYDSICGDGIKSKGEECEFTPSDLKVDPFQYVVARNSGESKVSAEAQSKQGESSVTVECICENDEMCVSPFPNIELGCGNEKCCYLAPKVESMIPVDDSTSVCRNAAIEAVFNQEMDESSFAGKVLIYKTGGGNMPIDVTTSTISGLVFGKVEIGADKKTKVSLRLKTALLANQTYQVKIFSGVKSKDGVAMKNNVEWSFFVKGEICSLSGGWVRIIPPEMFVFDLDPHPIEAVANSNTVPPQVITPTTGYSWEWGWLIADEDVIDFEGGEAKVSNSQNLQTSLSTSGAAKGGETTITAVATIIEDTINTPSTASSTKSASAPITVLICDNPWPARNPDRSWQPWKDEKYNFKFSLCRDFGEAHSIIDDLPTVGPSDPTKSIVPVPTPPTLDILQEYIIPINCAEDTPNCHKGDALGIRIMKNQEHYAIDDWYEKQGFGGSPKEITVNGFEALEEGRTIYINAANAANATSATSSDIWSNVYIFSYNQNASPYAQEIWKRISSNIGFLINLTNNNVCAVGASIFTKEDSLPIPCSTTIDCQKQCASGPNSCSGIIYCQAVKSFIKRDLKRLGQIRKIEENLRNYGATHATCSITARSCLSNSDCPTGETCLKKYPNLEGGTFMPNTSYSKWPSWQSGLGNALGWAVPVDPLNIFSALPPSRSGSIITAFNPETYFDSTNNTFYCPTGSKLYSYASRPDGRTYSLSFDLEYYELLRRATFLLPKIWKPDSGSFDEPVTKIYSSDSYSLLNNLKNTCDNTPKSAAVGVCGDGIVGSGEVCEPGQTRTVPCTLGAEPNVKNGFATQSCNANVSGDGACVWRAVSESDCQVGRCGDGVVQAPQEACDDGSLNGRYGKCGATCEGIGPYCGDGNPDVSLKPRGTPNLPYEQCDRSSLNGQYDSGCSSDCKLGGLACGDNVVNGMEECDGNTASSSENCAVGQVKTKTCGGNRLVQTQSWVVITEWCGRGGGCENVSSLPKNPTCGSSYCLEGCVLGRQESYLWYCGYELVNSPCKFGDWGVCAYPGTCGNGIKEGIEECDDNNKTNTDGCANDCKIARCGDGIVRGGSEMCDVGAANGTHCNPLYGGNCVYCNNSCQLVTRTGGFCGDERLQTSYEQCELYMECRSDGSCEPCEDWDCLTACRYDCRWLFSP